MFLKNSIAGLLVMAMALWTMPPKVLTAGDPIPVTGSGVGAYFPALGLYNATGSLDAFGDSVASGRVESEFIGPTTLSWQNFGNGNGNGNGSPKNEVLERFDLGGWHALYAEQEAGDRGVESAG